MAENRASPWLSNHIFVANHPPVRLEINPFSKLENKILMPKADELDQIAYLGVCSVQIPSQKMLLWKAPWGFKRQGRRLLLFRLPDQTQPISH